MKPWRILLDYVQFLSGNGVYQIALLFPRSDDAISFDF